MKTKRRLRKAKKPIPTHHKLIIGLSILVFAALLQVGLVKNLFTPAGAVAITDNPVSKKVFLLIFNPTIDQGGTPVKLTSYLNWFNPDTITDSLIPVFPTVSHGFLSYTVSERVEVDGWPTKKDGFVYNQASYLQCWQDHSTCHAQDAADFQKMFSDYGICSKNVDEVWVWGGPWFGYPEHQVVNFCGKSQFIMGFNYERGFDEAMHDFGHRMEFVTSDNGNRINNGIPWKQDTATEWNKFSRIETGCGNIHYPPSPYDYTFVNPDGSMGKPVHAEYDYSNNDPVTTTCDGYLNYPDGPFTTQTITCAVWGCTQGGYVQWWLSHIPAKTGTSIDPQTGRTLYNNWWKYYAYFDETDPDAVIRPYEQNLIGAWSFDEATGSTFQDSSNNNFNGAVTGTTVVPGHTGNARRFNGLGDIATVPANLAFSGMSELSISLWLKPEDMSMQDALVCNQTGDTKYSYCLFWIPEFQKIAFRVNGENQDLMSPDGSIQRDTWTHVVATYRGSTGQMALYINGQLCAGCKGSITPGNVGVNTNNLVFGGRYGIELLTGSLDEIRLYSLALNSAEAMQLYASLQPTSTPTAIPTATPTPTKTPTPTPTPADITPPTVAITSPLNNSKVSRSRTTVIKASAADASGIARVEFYVSGIKKCTDTVSPYTCSWSVPSARGVVYNLTANAYDTRGNTRASSGIKVTSQ